MLNATAVKYLLYVLILLNGLRFTKCCIFVLKHTQRYFTFSYLYLFVNFVHLYIMYMTNE